MGHVDRDGKADSVVPTAAGRDGRVDSDDFAVEVDQRSAAVTRVDGRIGLDVVLAFALADAPSLGADDAGRDRHVESEWTADCEHPVTDLHLIAVSHGNGFET